MKFLFALSELSPKRQREYLTAYFKGLEDARNARNELLKLEAMRPKYKTLTT